MNELSLKEYRGQAVVDSRDVAELIGRPHKQLLRTIQTMINHLSSESGNRHTFAPVKFFIPATYRDEKGEERPGYYLTREGCDLIANKMTGRKGTLFTAAYVSRFHEMEKELQKRRELRIEGKPVRRSLTDMIRDNPDHNQWDYKLYTDLAYKAAFGKTAGQMKKERAAKGRAIDLLTAEELQAYQRQEAAVAALYGIGMDYRTMKAVLVGSGKEV